ncbi:glycoside hydrolase family 65 [Armatimonas sp.]|uniref:glycoside hydrolase family 65 n=1 Tax=Armatimonas sp. TaxID=1872638 RepID=UPI00374D59E5
MTIDRKALVTRHDVVLTKPDALTPLQVGNGEFAFAVDITGLQSFPEFHKNAMQLGTQSQWGWHSEANPAGYTLEQTETRFNGVPYPDQSTSPAGLWLRGNPHRLQLGRLGFAGLELAALSEVQQRLSLWEGRIESRFRLRPDGQLVSVETLCHPTRDLVAVRLSPSAPPVQLHFPGPSAGWMGLVESEKHTTKARVQGTRADFVREGYHVALAFSKGATLTQTGPHTFLLTGAREIVLAFSERPLPEKLPRFTETKRTTLRHWERFWSTGGALELGSSAPERELERRIVLSQYLTAIQCAGSRPPQETGLVQNSWHGKFHLEMHWWHAAHFPLWGREALLERSLPWYEKTLPRAQETARKQGFMGARWPKMVADDGRESPSPVGIFLLWQQPHPIFFAELLYRVKPTKLTLQKYGKLVNETAAFLASYAKNGQLGPNLIPAQESYKHPATLNPTFELAYVWWALETAQLWRTRLGQPREAEWDRVQGALPKPNLREGIYTAIATPPYTITRDHPSMTAAYGLLPKTPLIDPEIMHHTLLEVERTWDWQSTWGWDYPMLAMTAARLKLPELAVKFLLLETPKNRYLANGHNYQRPNLPLYLPGNGGLLYAVALMVSEKAFPVSWTVKSEGLSAPI